MREKFDQLYGQARQQRQKVIEPPVQPGTRLISPEDESLRPEVRHFMNQVSVLRSLDDTLQASLLNQLAQGAEGYCMIDFSTPAVLSRAFALYMDDRISRFQIETLLDVYHSYHLVTYDTQDGSIVSEQHQWPKFYNLFDEIGQLTVYGRQLFTDVLANGGFFTTCAKEAEVQAILDKIRQLPRSEQFVYTVAIPNESHAHAIIKKIVALLGWFPLRLFQSQVDLIMVPVTVMHVIGEVLFQESYVPNSMMLGEISSNQVIRAMEVGVRLRASYIPWSNVATPGSFHKYRDTSVLSLTLHDIYHSYQATKGTNSVGVFSDALIKLIREKLLVNAVWNGPNF